MDYKPQIDGLRSIAVMPVIFYHMGVPSFSGGFLGVDVFFVISGYLITGIISEQVKEGTFTFKEFYMRRARRILPALYVVLFVCLIYMVLFQAPYWARDTAQGIVGTVFFAQNILLLIEANDYFSVNSDLKVLIHTWSLAVEEQFYLIYPLLLYLLYKFNDRLRELVLIVVIVLSLLLFFGIFGGKATAHFYLFPMRTWELGFGCLVWFYSKQNQGIHLTRFTVNFLSLLCIIALILCYLFFDNKSFYLGAIIACLSTANLLYLVDRPSIINQFLANRLFVATGLISYSLYLWHQPVLAIFRQNLISIKVTGHFMSATFVLLLIFLLSIATYFFIEKPIRQKKILKTHFLSSFAVLSLVLFSSGFAGHKLYGFEKSKVDFLPEDKRPFYISHFKEVKRNAKNGWNEHSNRAKNSSILVLGDSMAKDLVLSLRSVNVEASLIGLNLKCLQFKRLISSQCKQVLLKIEESLKHHKQVIFASDFASERNFYELENYVKNIKHTHDIKVMGNFKFYNASSLSYLFARYESKKDIREVFFKSLQNTMYNNLELKRIFGRENYIDKKSLFCSKNKICELYDKTGKPMFFDELHLTIEGQKYLGEVLLKLNIVSVQENIK